MAQDQRSRLNTQLRESSKVTELVGAQKKARKNIKRIITWVSSSLKRLQYASCHIYVQCFVFKYSWLGLKLWSEASKDLLRPEKWMDEQAAAPVFSSFAKFFSHHHLTAR